MSYRYLTVEEMIEVSRRWVTPAGSTAEGNPVETDRPLLEGNPLLAALLPELEDAHNGLLAPPRVEEAVPPEVVELRKEKRRVDVRHDSLIRAKDSLFDALLELIEDPAARASLEALARRAVPGGRADTKLSYRQESGAAQRLEAGLSEADRDALSKITLSVEGVLSTSLLALVEERVAKGKRLGELEDAEARALSSPAPRAPSQYELERNWIRQAQNLERLASSPRVPAELRQALLEPLHKAEQRALARLARPEEPASTEPKP